MKLVLINKAKININWHFGIAVALFDGSERIERGGAADAAAERQRRRIGSDADADLPVAAAVLRPRFRRDRRRLHHQRDAEQNGPWRHPTRLPPTQDLSPR